MRPIIRSLLGGGMVVLVILMAWQGWRVLDAPIEVVRISGELTDAERARAAELLSVHLPAGVLGVDMRGMRDLLEQESWVDSAALWRVWPDGIRVEIHAESVVARWRDGALLSNRGQVIEPLELVGMDSLPHLAGPEGSAERVMVAFQRVAEVLRPHELRIEALDMDADGSVVVRVRGGTEIDFGHQALGARLHRLDLVLRQQFPNGLANVERIDARYDNGIAVAWRGPNGTQDSTSTQLAQGF